MQTLTDSMIEYIQELEYEWYEQSMCPDFYELNEFEEEFE